MKKYIAWLLVILLLAANTAALAAGQDTFTVGTTTAMSGNFMGSMFGSNTADIDVQNLLHGYRLTEWDAAQGTYVFNARVVRRITSEKVDGCRRWNLYIRPDLYWSNGKEITAYDYAFSILLAMSPELQAIGGSISGSDYIKGSADYRSGAAMSLSGLRVLDNNRLVISIADDHTPDFFEMGLLGFVPYPMSVIAPGCSIRDGELGCSIQGDFTAELLARTLLDPDTGYVTNPAVVSGPYELESYDEAHSVATFTANKYYIGNRNRETVRIPHLTFRLVENDQIVSLLQSGEIDLMNKVTRADVADAALALAGEGIVKSNDYPRTGYSFVSFACEKETVASREVRQAIAHCFDKTSFIAGYVGSHGQAVDGYYGVGQWMYQRAIAGNPDALSALHTYAYDPAAAARLLEEAGWTVNGDGIREKDGVALNLRIIYPDGNEVGSFLEGSFRQALAEAGIQLTVEARPFTELLRAYYRQTERNADMIYLASNFGVVFDPSDTFNPAEAYQGVDNRTGLKDSKLYSLAVNMRSTEPGDADAYISKWLAFQQQFTDVLPTIPVYSNTYYDFFTPALKNYNPGAEQTWSQAIVGAYLAE